VTIQIVMPVRNDWTPAFEVIRQIGIAMETHPVTIDVLMIDDGSTADWKTAGVPEHWNGIRRVAILELRRNVGHQRAIAIGLFHVQRTIECDALLVMDADGEDTAAGVADLVCAFTAVVPRAAIFAERRRRSESVMFQVFYAAYRIIHRVLTGVRVKVGNFSILPSSYVGTLLLHPELWNHYAAAVFRSRLAYRMIPIPRGTRLAGKSNMDFVSLVVHGLSAISVFGDVVGVRVLIMTMTGGLLTILGILSVIVEYVLTERAIPGWGAYTVALLVVIFFQLLTIAASFTFVMLSGRATASVLPLRDAARFISRVHRIQGYE
jgi:hypothetical protein